MRKREEGHEILDTMEELGRQPAVTPEGDQSHLSTIYQRMILVKEAISDHGKLQNYLAEMLSLFVADSVDLNQKVVHNEKKVSSLENKIGSIHTIDFKAQSDA